MTGTVKVTPINNLTILNYHYVQMYTTGLHIIIIDIDECSGLNGCQQMCQNTDGSYICSCSSGFFLSPNGKECTGELNGRMKSIMLHLIPLNNCQ